MKLWLRCQKYLQVFHFRLYEKIPISRNDLRILGNWVIIGCFEGLRHIWTIVHRCAFTSFSDLESKLHVMWIHTIYLGIRLRSYKAIVNPFCMRRKKKIIRKMCVLKKNRSIILCTAILYDGWPKNIFYIIGT